MSEPECADIAPALRWHAGWGADVFPAAQGLLLAHQKPTAPEEVTSQGGRDE